MDKGKGKAGGEEELAKAAKQLNINNYSASFKMQELEPEFSPDSTDFYGAPISPRISTELGGAFLMGNNPYLEKPILKLHEPILPKSLSAVLESIPTTPVDDKDAIGTGTKVVVTIGPACQDVETMVELIRNGMSCARIDLTNGDIEFHVRSIRNLQEASSLTMRMVAIMVDTVGPEIFVISGRPTSHEEGWPKWGKATDVEEGQTVVLTSDGVSSFSNDRWPVTYPKFSDLCKVGDRITVGRYLSTGMEGTSVTLEVKAIINDHDVECVSLGEATLNGLITVFLQDKSALGTPSKRANVDLPILSPRDTEMIKILGEYKQQGSDCLDFVALSYASTMEEIESVRKTLDAYGLANTKIIAKIETKRALNSFESILKAADGVIFSRGNLGIDVPVEKFPMLQKTLIRACNLHGKPVLATRVVDSMTNSPRPTRAEATDISNLVIDGIDGIVLGSETLRGMFPVVTVKTVLHCAKEAEKVYDNTQHFTNIMKKSGLLSQLESMASSSVRVADKIEASLIVVVTGSGRTARIVAKYRPSVPVIALTVPRIRADSANKWCFSGRHQARQSLIVRGLYPMLAIGAADEMSILEDAVQRAADIGIAKAEDHIVVLYNPTGAEVPVIELVSMDKISGKISQRYGSVASELMNKGNRGSERTFGSSSSSLNDDSNVLS